MNEAAQKVVRDSLNADAFFLPAPGKVRIEGRGDDVLVFLDHPGFALERAVVEVRIEPARFIVARNILIRGGEWLSVHVGTVPFDRPHLLRRCLGMALTGTSRLPITSVETPHPVFTLGMLAYAPETDRSVLDRARTLEARLRSGSPVGLPIDDLPSVVKTLFNHLALSPWGPLVANLIDLVKQSEREVALDLFGYMLRHLSRHLNAFDLVKFHNLGANYPDALMLDAVLRAFIGLLRGSEGQLHRRALRQGWLARKRCEGLRVPVHPTSPGENARDMPHPPVPQAHLTDAGSRAHRLFVDQPAESMLTPIVLELFDRSIADLSNESELRELGTAVFLDRPLGVGKRDGEEDRTVLLSYEACSPRLIRTRLTELHAPVAREIPSIPGFPVARFPGHSRSGVVSLEDAKKVALDFVFTRTTRSSLNDLLDQYDWSVLGKVAPDVSAWLSAGEVLLIRTKRRTLSAFDAGMTARFQLSLPDPATYTEIGAVEYAEELTCTIGKQTVSLFPRW